MNDISKGRSPSAASRIARGVGAAALSAVLIGGLAGCMTGKVAANAPVVQRNAVAPAGVDLGQPADRIAEQLASRDVSQGSWTDRVTAQAEFAARNGGSTATNPYPGMTADHIDRLLVQAR